MLWCTRCPSTSSTGICPIGIAIEMNEEPLALCLSSYGMQWIRCVQLSHDLISFSQRHFFVFYYAIEAIFFTIVVLFLSLSRSLFSAHTRSRNDHATRPHVLLSLHQNSFESIDQSFVVDESFRWIAFTKIRIIVAQVLQIIAAMGIRNTQQTIASIELNIQCRIGLNSFFFLHTKSFSFFLVHKSISHYNIRAILISIHDQLWQQLETIKTIFNACRERVIACAFFSISISLHLTRMSPSHSVADRCV